MIDYIKKIHPYKLLTIAFLINTIYLIYFQITDIPGSSILSYFWVKGHFILFPAWLFYFTFGYYLGVNYDQIKGKFNKHIKFYIGIFLTMMLPILILKYFNIISIVSSKRVDILLYTVFFVMMVLAIFRNANGIPMLIKWINKYSFSIYLLHMIPMVLLPGKIFSSFWLNVIFLFLLGIISSCLVSYILNKFKYGYLMIGKKMVVRNMK